MLFSATVWLFLKRLRAKNMSNAFFRFKQFTVWHDKCAMKVGTDGVLLGAWSEVADAKHILDVGTGTGVIALQLAQRNTDAMITAIEIDETAARQAMDNVQQAPWADRIRVVCCDFQNFQTKETYDLIVSNPPYFMDTLKSPDKRRSLARHTIGLTYDFLFSRSAILLSRQGKLNLIFPPEVEKDVMDCARRYQLCPLHRTHVFTKPNKPCRRILLSLGRTEEDCVETELFIEQKSGEFTPEYIALTKDFYLKM